MVLPLDGQHIEQGEQVELSFWAQNHNLTNRISLHVEYFDGNAWSTLLSLGPDKSQLYSPYRILIPDKGLGRDVIFFRPAVECAELPKNP